MPALEVRLLLTVTLRHLAPYDASLLEFSETHLLLMNQAVQGECLRL